MLALLTVSLGLMLAQVPASQAAFRRLTVPADLLPAGCRVVPSPSRELGNGRVLVGLWDNLRIDTNPWFGDDPKVLADLYVRMSGAPLPRTPDGPPPDRRESTAFFRKLVDGIDEGYAAFYEDAAGERVTVYALRFADAQRAAVLAAPRKGEKGPAPRLASGNVALMVLGEDTECRRRIVGHLQSVVREEVQVSP